ncbi:TetR/AcrR family transcriptional regulator [Nocardia mangyaensis]|uniref:TetR/AcrR family transcriptional regulator n=1 Tax=Nocardia mangyaensis TaxID=2213200 RepID=UPI00267606A1|nr:TetR/AcrR family transcriptional regulator [Nocardia mangyaensis]MDO3646798.1 TetR/AcrR family transcriptional regulator [Nocardia mangyaensis]
MPPQADKQRKRPKQDRARETRTRILTVSAQLFGTRGISNTSTNRIAAEAGMSIGTLYRYFTDRDEIVKELTDSLFLQVEERYAKLLTVAVDKTPRDAVAEVIHIAVEVLVSNGPLVRALVADLQFYGSGIPEFEPRLRMIIKLYLIQILGPTTGVDIDTMAFIFLNTGFATALRSVEMEEQGLDREVVIAKTADMIGSWITTVTQESANQPAADQLR